MSQESSDTCETLNKIPAMDTKMKSIILFDIKSKC